MTRVVSIHAVRGLAGRVGFGLLLLCAHAGTVWALSSPILIAPDPEMLLLGEPALIPEIPDSLGLAAWRSDWENARQRFDSSAWQERLRRLAQEAIARNDLRDTVRSLLERFSTRGEAVDTLMGKVDNDPDRVRSLARTVAELGWPVIAAELYSRVEDGSADGARSALARAKLLESMGFRSQAINALEQPALKVSRKGGETLRALREQAAVALADYYLRQRRYADAVSAAQQVPDQSPWWGEAQLRIARGSRMSGDSLTSRQVASALIASTDRADQQIGAGCEYYRASPAGDQQNAEAWRLVRQYDGLDTLQAAARQAYRAQNGLCLLSLAQFAALVNDDSLLWLRAWKIAQGLQRVLDDAWAEAVGGPAANRILTESYRLSLLNSRPVTDASLDLSLDARESVLINLLLRRRELLLSLFLRDMDLGLSLSGACREDIKEVIIETYLEELTEALRLREQFVKRLVEVDPSGASEEERKFYLSISKEDTNSFSLNTQPGPKGWHKAGNLLAIAQNELDRGAKDVERIAEQAYWSAPAMSTAEKALELRALVVERGISVNTVEEKRVLLRAAEAAGPGVGKESLLKAGYAGLQSGSDQGRWSRSVAAYLLGTDASVTGVSGDGEALDPFDLCAASLLAETGENESAAVDTLSVILERNPVCNTEHGVDLWLALGWEILGTAGPVAAMDSILAFAAQNGHDAYVRARIDRLAYHLAERRGSSNEQAWNRRMEAAKQGLSALKRPAWEHTGEGAKWLAQCAEEAYEALNLATEQAQQTDDRAWRQRAVAATTVLESAVPGDPRTAAGWANVAALYEKRDRAEDLQQAIRLYLHTAGRWPRSPSAKLSADRALALADRLVRQSPAPAADSLLIAAARLRAGRSTDPEELAGTLQLAGVTLRKTEQWQPASTLFLDVLRGYPETKVSEDALEGWLECELAMGHLRAVAQMNDSLMSEGASGRRALALRRAMTRVEVLIAKRLQEAGLEGEAAAALERAGGLDADPELSAWALFEAGHNAEDRGNRSEARSAYSMVLDWYPEQEAAPSAAVAIARMREEEVTQQGKTPSREESREVAGLYEGVAGDYPASEQAPAALVHAAEIYRAAGDRVGEQRSLTTLLNGYPGQEGVLELGRRAGLLAWGANELTAAHDLFLTLTKRAPRSREAVAAFVYLGNEATRNGRASDAEWAYTMALHAQADEEKAGRHGDAAFAHEAALALAEQNLPAFLAIRYGGRGGVTERRREQKLALGTDLVKRYRDAAQFKDVAAVRALLGMADVEEGMADAEQFKALPNGLPSETLAVRTQEQALASWAHRKSAIEALKLARTRAHAVAGLRDSLRAARVDEETVLIRTGLQADRLCHPELSGRGAVEALADSAAHGILKQYDLGIAAQDKLLASFATLPDRGETKLEKDVYRLALIDEFLRPRIRFLLELKVAARRAARELGRTPGSASTLFAHTRQKRTASEMAIQVMEADLPARLEAYRQEVARAANTVVVEPLEEQSEKIIDLQQLAVDLSWLDIDLWRDQLAVVATEPDLKRAALERARTAMKAALEHATEMDRHARLNRQEAQQYRERYETMRSEGLLAAVRLHEDLADGWERGAQRVLEPAWAIAAELGLRPRPEVDAVARELARRDPAEYAYAVGLKETERSGSTDGHWTWRRSEEGDAQPVTVLRKSLSWSAAGGVKQPELIAADPTVREAWFEGTVSIQGTLSSAKLAAVASRRYEVYLNGRFAAETVDGGGVDGKPEEWNVTDLVVQGQNRIRVRLSGEGAENALALRLTWNTVGEVRDDLKAVFPDERTSSR